MQRMPYRGYVIEVLWKADHRYAVHLFPHDQANVKANRSIKLGEYDADTRLTSSDGSYRLFVSVTEAMERAMQHIDELRNAALAIGQR